MTHSFRTIAGLALLAAFGLSGCAAKFTNQQLIDRFDGIDVETEETDRGFVIYLPQVYFEFDSSNLTSEARDKIAEVADVVAHRRASDRQLAVEGHTDNVGAEEYNLSLSQERAERVAQELSFSGVDMQRLKVKGMGESQPRMPNELDDCSPNEEGRALNRRVEIIVLNGQLQP